MGIDGELTPRCQYIRVICCELARVSAHLLGVGCFAMDVGALTVFMHTFTEREKIYNLAEWLTGARFTTSYTRIGGLARDLPRAGGEMPQSPESKSALPSGRFSPEPHLGGSDARCRRHLEEMAIDYAFERPNLRASGQHDLQSRALSVLSNLQFDIPVGSVAIADRYRSAWRNAPKVRSSASA
jgi:NADH-quinone oxidoreductase subunit D